MTKQDWPEWTDKYITERMYHGRDYKKGSTITVEAGLHYIQGNSDPYFSVTAEIKEPGHRDISAGGCLRDEVLFYFPRLAPVVALHLSSIDGTPTYAVANGLYHLGFGKWSCRNDEYAASHFRISLSEVLSLIESIQDGSGYDPEKYATFINECIPRWQAEAKAARIILQTLIVEKETSNV